MTAPIWQHPRRTITQMFEDTEMNRLFVSCKSKDFHDFSKGMILLLGGKLLKDIK